MRFEKIWIEPCRATKAIKRRFGATSRLDYVIGEKLIAFADAATNDPEFARELPRFLSAVWQMFNQFEIAGYVARRKPATRGTLRQLDPTTSVIVLLRVPWMRCDPPHPLWWR